MLPFIKKQATKKSVPTKKTLSGVEKSPYDPAFVKKILQSEKNIKEGRFFSAKRVEDIWK